MVVKQVSAKKGTGSFSGLANYLLDKKNNGKKVYEYEFTNTNFSQDIDLNLEEIKITSNLNQTATSDKVLHLVVSFHEDEHPSKEVLQKIERELVKAIDMQEHQRLVVAHNNTNNFHIHIAINKIDPKTYKIIDPYQSKKKLAQKALELEKSLNLKQDQKDLTTNRENKKEQNDIEIHTGVKNFITWIKDEALLDITKLLNNKKATFEDLQKLLAEFNLEFKLRGNGLVIAHKSKKLYVKSSSIHRNLSKPNLIKRFKTVELKTINIKAKKEFGVPSHNLWEEYKKESNLLRAKKEQLLKEAKLQNSKAKELIKNRYNKLILQNKKDLILTSKAKRNIYKSIFANRKKEYQKLSKEYKLQRSEIHKKTNQIQYKEFLIKKALNGDSVALSLLRRSKVPLEPNENAILGKSDNKIFITKEPYITKQGLVIYRIGEYGKIIDKGDRLRITIDDNEQAIKEMLEMSIVKYGNNLDVSGDIKFKQKVIEVTKKYNLKINFKDNTMQKITKALNNTKQNSARRAGQKLE